MRSISFHLLRNMPCTNANRQKDGAPKSMFFGGVKRGRWSSQTQNSALRKLLLEKFPAHCGVRTSHLADLVREEALKNPSIQGDASSIKAKIPQLFRAKKEEREKTQMLLLSPGDAKKMADEIARFKAEAPDKYAKWLDPDTIISDMISNAFDDYVFDEDTKEAILKKPQLTMQRGAEKTGANLDLRNPTEEAITSVVASLHASWIENPDAIKDLLKGGKSAGAKVSKDLQTALNDEYWSRLKKQVGEMKCETIDAALFGRMVTEEAFANVTGAMTTAHAIGVNEYVEIADFFTCFDDISQRVEHIPGPGDDKLLHSTMFYQYYSINLDVLVANFPKLADKKLLTKVMETIAAGLFNVVPHGMALKTASNVPANAMLIEYSDTTSPVNYANAFEKPVKPGVEGGILEPAVAKLSQFVGNFSVEQPDTRRLWLCHERLPFQYVAGDGRVKAVPGVKVVESVAAAAKEAASLVTVA